MKNQKIKFAIEQILIILVYNYFFLFDSYIIYCEYVSPAVLFAITFFNAGTFSSLYITLETKNLTNEKESFLFNFNNIIYLSSIGMALYDKCLIKSNHLMLSYFIGLFLIWSIVFFVHEAFISFKKIKSVSEVATH